MSGLTCLSWAPSTSFFHDIQAISSHAKQVLPQQDNPFPLSGIKIEKPGGIRPDVFSLFFHSLFKDLDRPWSTHLLVLLQVPGVGSLGVLIHKQRVRQGLTAALFSGVTFSISRLGTLVGGDGWVQPLRIFIHGGGLVKSSSYIRPRGWWLGETVSEAHWAS